MVGAVAKLAPKSHKEAVVDIIYSQVDDHKVIPVCEFFLLRYISRMLR